jgi:16S rRNA (uracil1498-N3)-methyltransferase
MRHRIYVPLPLTGEVPVEGDEFHHAVRVARVREGEEVELFDGRGAAARGVVGAVERERAFVRVVGPLPSRESPVAFDLAMAVIQLEKFELVLQKATELGARGILPLVSDRVEVRPERYRGKQGRWEKIVFEATKQCGRATIATVLPPETFDAAMGRENKILFEADAPPSSTLSGEPLTLFIGPEGGWSDRELALARSAGARFQSLGPRRLRAETAAIVAAWTAAAALPSTPPSDHTGE